MMIAVVALERNPPSQSRELRRETGEQPQSGLYQATVRSGPAFVVAQGQPAPNSVSS